MPQHRSLTKLAYVGAGVMVVLLLTSCGGSSKAKNKVDPAKADELAHVAMPSPRDLPGGGWTIASVDEFSGDDLSVFEGVKACDKFVETRKTIQSKLDPKRAGRAERELERDTSGLLNLSADFEVVIYSDTDLLSDTFEQIAKATQESFFADCVTALYQSVLGSNARAKVVPPTAAKVEGGYAFAADVELTQGATALRFETYSWPFGNSAVSVDISGVKSDVTAEFVKAAIAQAQAGMERAASPNPPTAVPAVIASSTPQRSITSSTPAQSGSGGDFKTLSSLKTYRYVVKIEGSGGPLADVASQLGSLAPSSPSGGAAQLTMEVSGTYVAPNRGQYTIKLGALTVTVTTIGNQQWSALGTIAGTPKTITPDDSDYSFVASLWDDSFIDIIGFFGCSNTTEQVNGVRTRKCGLDSATFDQLRSLVGASLGVSSADFKSFSKATMEAWVAQPDGYPVRMNFDLAGIDSSDKPFTMKMAFDITDANSTALKVDAPR